MADPRPGEAPLVELQTVARRSVARSRVARRSAEGISLGKAGMPMAALAWPAARTQAPAVTRLPAMEPVVRAETAATLGSAPWRSVA
ncbi:MAG: hypothetical protein M9947_05205 [Thermomicrobiales bacterium]|nr:hypothetical protein [Thermomicrobiales bacterium]